MGASLPPGWTMVNGLPVPAIPGVTTPPLPPAPPPASTPPTYNGPRRRYCGAVKLDDGTQISLDCLRSGYATIPGASRTPLRHALITERFDSDMSLPPYVNHREDGTEGPVRHQGSVGACTAFSLAAAVDHAIRRHGKRHAAVSVMHIWSRYSEPHMAAALHANEKRPLAMEQAWPWDASLGCRIMHPDEGQTTCECGYLWKSACGETLPSRYREYDAFSHAVTHITTIAATPHAIKETLARGQDVWFTAKLWADPLLGMFKGANIPDYDARSEEAGHAMVLAGYRETSAGTQYLIHNSWGELWRDGGYAWIHEQTLMRNTYGEVYAVDAERTVRESSSFAPEAQDAAPEVMTTVARPTSCPSALPPDAVSGACSPPCPDGSPRAARVCGSIHDCPKGYINMFGVCVMAAPHVRGHDPSTRVGWQCSYGGCTYSYPHRQFGCTFPQCSLSCPAPRFQLAVGARGVHCSE
ncbi:MAG: C1 family peptidase [Deltaproteobacteria bacterium]|nr:C1 family peptidase [Deltaproteobacteria bacterium]